MILQNKHNGRIFITDSGPTGEWSKKDLVCSSLPQQHEYWVEQDHPYQQWFFLSDQVVSDKILCFVSDKRNHKSRRFY